jgi:predicted AAA+ superfamily ATPase
MNDLPEDLVSNLNRINPWWRGAPQSSLPSMRRWLFPTALRRLKGGLAPATVIIGPRQVGKSTMVEQIIGALLAEGVAPQRICYLQFDELPVGQHADMAQPILRIADWYEANVLGRTFNAASNAGEPAYVLMDEMQNLEGWAPQLKFLVDTSAVRVMVTGSSSMRIEEGRDSLAGRISTLVMGPLLLREVLEIRGEGSIPPYMPANGIGPLKEKDFWHGLREHGEQYRVERKAAFAAFAARGGYPVAQRNPDVPWEEVADQLLETVIRRAVQHDTRVEGRTQDTPLLDALFRIVCRYTGQIPEESCYRGELREALHENISWMRVLANLQVLDDTLLVRLIPPLELRLKGKRGPSKPCLCDHALRAAWLQEPIALTPEALLATPDDAVLAGRLAESIVGYYFASIPNLDTAHQPERGADREVDFVLTVGDQRIPVEVKYRRRIDWEDSYGLRSFIEKAANRAPFGILVTLNDEMPRNEDPRIVSLPLSSLLLMR